MRFSSEAASDCGFKSGLDALSRARWNVAVDVDPQPYSAGGSGANVGDPRPCLGEAQRRRERRPYQPGPDALARVLDGGVSESIHV
jgi:hypothetical protein